MSYQHLGFIDWGIGGLSVLREIQKRTPVRATYVSDSGFTPYGKLSKQDLRLRLFKIFSFLKEKNIDAIVVACNAASTAILDVTDFEGVPIYNVITPTLNALKQSQDKRLGVIGGDRTVESRVYSQALQTTERLVFEQSTQPLSALIELGKVSEDDVLADLQTLLAPLVAHEIDSLVLACTHYPAISPVIEKNYPQWKLIDPAVYVADELSSHLQSSQSVGLASYFTSGSREEMISAAQKAFGHRIFQLEKWNS